MSIRARDITPINEAGTCLLELADEAVAGAGKVLTRNGSPYVAIVDARKLSYYHALEAEHDRLIMLGDAEWGWQMHSQAGCSPRKNSVSHFGALVKGLQGLTGSCSTDLEMSGEVASPSVRFGLHRAAAALPPHHARPSVNQDLPRNQNCTRKPRWLPERLMQKNILICR